MIVTKQIEGLGTVWYDDSNPIENMFKTAIKSAAVAPSQPAPPKAAVEEEQKESAYIILKKAMFGL